MSVEITYPNMHPRNRHRSYKEYSGEPEEVVKAVVFSILNDRVTQCYEHMRESVCKARVEDGKLKVLTCKNLYAGD